MHKLTPQQFFDLFMVLLYWQWHSVRYHKRVITVDTVIRLLTACRYMSKKQGPGIYKDKEMQDYFLKFIVLRDWKLGRAEKKLYLGGQGKYLIYRETDSVEVNVNRLMMDRQLELSVEGEAYARSVLDAPHVKELGEYSFMAFRAAETKRFDDETGTKQLPKGRIEKGRIERIDKYVEVVEDRLAEAGSTEAGPSSAAEAAG